jgi:2,4-dienoyl-CoA reductase-like NADH-dependent reductase (Old Yellow Enzyme family)
MTHLFDPLTLRGVTLANRIGVSPMCMYCCDDDGMPTDWHLAHLLQRAIGGAGMVMVEATAITDEGRITPGCVGLWSDAHIPGHARLARAMAQAGTVPAIQIGHAGRKGSRLAGWLNGPAVPGWQTRSSSDLPTADFAAPRAMTGEEVAEIPALFAATAKRAVEAGYRLIELHGAHGYLLHQFFSPICNNRNDRWGGDFEGRTRLTLESVKAVRAAVPDWLPLSLRISHTDWIEGGWTTEESVELARRVQAAGIDLMDVSSGGIEPNRQKIPIGPGYQVPGAQAVREGTGVATAAVGLITEPEQAQAIVAEGKADMVLLARAVLRDPYWPVRAAVALGRAEAVKAPPQYERGWAGIAKLGMRMETAEPMGRL